METSAQQDQLKNFEAYKSAMDRSDIKESVGKLFQNLFADSLKSK